MRKRHTFFVFSLLFVGLLFLHSCGIIGSNPRLPLSDKNGTVRLFTASEPQVVAAISNAFADFKYRDMSLESAIATDRSYLVSDFHPTNGFILFPLNGAITYVPVLSVVGRKRVPYTPYFHIVVTAVDTNKVNVGVRTFLAFVADGWEIGIHGGTAFHQRIVRPVRREEANVLAAIDEELAKVKPP